VGFGVAVGVGCSVAVGVALGVLVGVALGVAVGLGEVDGLAVGDDVGALMNSSAAGMIGIKNATDQNMRPTPVAMAKAAQLRAALRMRFNV